MNGIRLQLVLAKAGVASRRGSETLITAGRVAVNGHVVTELGTRVDPIRDSVTVDGREVQREPPAYYLLNKPKGYVTTASDPEGRQTVFELLPDHGVRLFAVGRLDYNTEGALLLTNDGELAHILMHPSRGIEKVYHAKLRGRITHEQVERLRLGVVLPPARPLDSAGRPQASPYPRAAHEKQERSAPCEVIVRKETGQHTWLEVILHEGKNRQIHRMAEAIGSSLLKLQRVEYAGLSIADLPIGEARPLSRREIAELRKSAGLTPQLAAPPVAVTSRQPASPAPTAKPAPRAAARPAPPRSAEHPARGDAPPRSRGPRRPDTDAPRSADRPARGDAPPRSRGPRRDTDAPAPYEQPRRSARGSRPDDDRRPPRGGPPAGRKGPGGAGRSPRRPTYAPSSPR